MFDRVTKLLNEEIDSGRSGLRELERKLGINTASLKGYIKGENEPRQKALESIAKYFDVSVSYLRGETDDPTRLGKGPPYEKVDAAHLPVAENKNNYNHNKDDPGEDTLIKMARWYAPDLTMEQKKSVVALMAAYSEAKKAYAQQSSPSNVAGRASGDTGTGT